MKFSMKYLSLLNFPVFLLVISSTVSAKQSNHEIAPHNSFTALNLNQALFLNENFKQLRTEVFINIDLADPNKDVLDLEFLGITKHVIYFHFSDSFGEYEGKNYVIGAKTGTCFVDGELSFTLNVGNNSANCEDEVYATYFSDVSCRHAMNFAFLTHFTDENKLHLNDSFSPYIVRGMCHAIIPQKDIILFDGIVYGIGTKNKLRSDGDDVDYLLTDGYPDVFELYSPEMCFGYTVDNNTNVSDTKQCDLSVWTDHKCPQSTIHIHEQCNSTADIKIVDDAYRNSNDDVGGGGDDTSAIAIDDDTNNKQESFRRRQLQFVGTDEGNGTYQVDEVYFKNYCTANQSIKLPL